MVKKWRKIFNETRTVLTDLSKAFGCIDHNLLIDKLNAYGFEKRSLEFTFIYINKEPKFTLPLVPRKCYPKVCHKGQSKDVFYQIPISLIFDMFFETPKTIDFAGYVDDSTPCTYIPKIFQE